MSAGKTPNYVLRGHGTNGPDLATLPPRSTGDPLEDHRRRLEAEKAGDLQKLRELEARVRLCEGVHSLITAAALKDTTKPYEKEQQDRLLTAAKQAYDDVGLSARYEYIGRMTKAFGALSVEEITSLYDVQEQVGDQAASQDGDQKNANTATTDDAK